ncbi:MAG TPA: hypothetical protein VK890_11220, partial [Bacteroidia bacterium]|nr:hypothetical protein [Bacteroidia bacterium]
MIKALQKKHHFFSLKVLVAFMGFCFYQSSTAQTIFYQDFEKAMTSSINGGVVVSSAGSADLPQAQTWTGGGGGANEYWANTQETRAQAGWTSSDDLCCGTCNASDCPGTCAGNGALVFDAYDVPSGQTGYVQSPVIDLSAYSSACNSVSLSFCYYNVDETSLEVLFSTNSGTSFTHQITYGQVAGGWTTETITIPSASCVSTFEMKFIATSGTGVSPIGIDQVTITASSSGPTTQASAITYSGVTCNSTTVSWANGNGADRIVVAYPNSTITTPTSGTTYTANTIYGSGTGLGAGFVVYNGIGTSVSVTGLSASTTYYYAVFEYNAPSCYLTPGVSSNQATPACAACPTTAATAITYSGVTCSSMTVSWTNGNGADEIVVAYPNNTLTTPVNGTTYTANNTYASGTGLGAGFVVYNGSGTSVNVSGLSASTTYWFAVFEYNTTACYYTAGAPHTSQATPACPACPTTNSSALSYSGVTCSGMTLNWTNGNGANRIVVAYPNSTITNPTNTTSYTANTAYGSGTGVGAGFVVYNGTGSTVTVSGLSASTTYYFAIFEYNTIACYLTPGVSSNQATIACGACPSTNASALSFSHVGCNAIEFSWTNGNGANRIVVVYPSAVITNPTNSTTYTANYTYGSGTAVGLGSVVYNGTGSSVTVLGLSANTTYYFAVFEYNITACYLTPGASSNKKTTTCTNCPYMSIAETDGCNGNVGCNEGDTEWLLFNTCSYGWDNSADPPTVNYGSNPFPAWTHSTNTYLTDGGTPGTTAAINTAAGCNVFIDASAGGVVIPPWSNVLFCAVGTEASNAWCSSGYTWTGICAYAPIY